MKKRRIVSEALQGYSASETPTPDTGALQTDLLELLRGIITGIQTPLGKVIDQIVALLLSGARNTQKT